MIDGPVPGFEEVLRTLLARRELTADQMRGILNLLVEGRCPEAEAAAFLIALRMKGETSAELAAAALVLRAHMRAWNPGRAVLDTCGTGGDQSGTFNISTAAAFVIAAAGVPVVKHGNRSVSSRSGSADVLAALGIRIETDPELARRVLDEANLAFCFAPSFHPALKNVASLRRRLGVPTVLNSLGPLANPAGAAFQLLGVGRPELLDLMAGALALLGTGHALVVRGEDGLDEVSLAGPTQVREVRGTAITAQQWTPADLGLEPCRGDDLRADGPPASAAMILDVLKGRDCPAARVVAANAAAGLLAAGAVASLAEGVQRAKQVLKQGSALAVLEHLRRLLPATP